MMSRPTARPRFALAAFALIALAVLSFGGSPTKPIPATENTPAFVPAELIVKFKTEAGSLDKSLAQNNLAARHLQSFRSNAELWELTAGASVEDAVRQLKARSDVEYAEPNYILTVDVLPNDPLMADLWNMFNEGQTGGTLDADIDAEMAWGVSTGSHSVVVASIDTGVDYNHPDLAANIWTNPGETPDNGIDDDDNGYIDDVHGWDWVNDDNDPFDDNGHGTHTSGTIGAVGDNGIGVAGVNWDVSIMALKFLGASGGGAVSDAVRAVEYATMMGADLSNNSWGGGGYSRALYDAIAAAGAADHLFVAAAGNDGQDNDVLPHYPSNYDLPNIISVAATDHNDQYAYFSNWGAVSVDLAAPGVEILSTLPGNAYGYGSGTSMASPHVAGVAALIRAISPAVPWAQIKALILGAAEDVTNPTKPTSTNARLNAFFAIGDPDDIPPAPITDLATTESTSNTIGLAWTATGDDGTDGTAASYEVRYSTAPIDDTNWDLAALAPNVPRPAPSGTPESMEVTGLDAGIFYYFAIKALDEWATASALSANATGTTLPPPTALATPLSITDSLITGESSTHIVTLTNVGVGTLDFTIPTPLAGDRVGVRAGGPDGGGYRWTDSFDPGGPGYEWRDISLTGNRIHSMGDDDVSSPIALDFMFPFYGQFFDSLRVCTNGFISFTSSSTAPHNGFLPSSGAPENLVAPFWTDLNTNFGGGEIYYQVFPDQAIVQYNDMLLYFWGDQGPYTFQVVLDASGTIAYRYKEMGGWLDIATVGIQDGSKTRGTTVVYDDDYLQSANFAIRFEMIPQWLTVSPVSGRLHAGESVQFNVHLDASGLDGGLYSGEVHVLTNDPANPDIVVSLSLDVEGGPDAVSWPESLDYGDSYQETSADRTLTVINVGDDVLHVDEITISNDAATDFTVSPAHFDLAPNDVQEVTVTWTPSVPGPFSGSLTVFSDDAGEPEIVIPVTGNVFPAPEVVLDPRSFEDTLGTGQTSRHTLSVTNPGEGPLEVSLAATDVGEGSLVVVDDEGITGSGGPDSFGYRWSDSDDPGGPTFDWVDISTIGTPVDFGENYNNDDITSGPIPIGFAFPFYGNTFSTINVCSNGWLSFTSTSTHYENGTLPGDDAPENLLAPFFDDLTLYSPTATVHSHNDGARFIVQYTDVQGWYDSASLTFQVILYPSGKIVYQYLSMHGTLDSTTIGIQNADRSIGLQVVNNEDYVHDELAIRISRTPDWLTVSPWTAMIPAGASYDFEVAFDATGRDGGDYNGEVVLDTNVGHFRTPATLHVIGVPRARVIPDAFDYETRFVGYSHLTNFQIVNTGNDVLHVSAVVTTDPTLVIGELQTGTDGQQITPLAGGFSLAPGAGRLLGVAWQPEAAGPLVAEVVVHSDDPVNPTLSVNVTGDAIWPPVSLWSPASFTEVVPLGETVTRTLHLENQGGSDLDYDVSLLQIGAANVTVYPEVKVAKGEEGPGPGILGTGGPDMFGYEWLDSDEPGGPVFDWIDIAAIGTLIDFGQTIPEDRNVGPFPIGFDFPFYGDSFSTVQVCTNGWLSFTSTLTDPSNAPLPGLSAPENLLAAFHDDLRFVSDNAAAHYYNDGTRFIVQYTNVQRYPNSGSLTFQVILYPNGRIVFQYLTMQGTLGSATIGIQNATRNDGLTVVYDEFYVRDGLAILFRPQLNWLEVSPTSGTVPPGGAVDLDVTIDTSLLLYPGEYAANIDLSINDPVNARIRVPVSLNVNLPPVALCVDAALPTGPEVCSGFASIDAGSYDPEGGAVSVTQNPPGPYGLGQTLVTLHVTDETGLANSCEATVTVVDAVPPEIAVQLAPGYLWPPSHHMEEVEATVVVTDNCPASVAILTSLASNEPDNGPGDGNTIHDTQDAELGTSDFTFKLRAERSANGDGRIYTAVYTAMDTSGNMTSAEAYAVVPHDQDGMSDAMAIHVAESAGGTLVSWGEVPGVESYSVIRGRLDSLLDAGDAYDLGSVFCIENRGLDASTAGAEDFDVPLPGQAFFYLVELHFIDGSSSTFGTESAAKPRRPAAAACE